MSQAHRGNRHGWTLAASISENRMDVISLVAVDGGNIEVPSARISCGVRNM